MQLSKQVKRRAQYFGAVGNEIAVGNINIARQLKFEFLGKSVTWLH